MREKVKNMMLVTSGGWGQEHVVPHGIAVICRR